MSAAIFGRRRAERLARLLDEAAGSPRHHAPRSHLDDELAPLVTIGQELTRLRLDGEPDPDFRAGLRAMLVAAAERELKGAPQADPPRLAGAVALRPAAATRTRLRTRGAIIIAVATGALAVSGMSAASGDAMPGDALYGIKRSTERAQLALTSSDVSRGQLYLEFAKTRAAEAQAVRTDPALLAAALDDTDAQTLEGVRLLTAAAVKHRDPVALDLVDGFVKVQRTRLSALQAATGSGAGKRVAQSLTLLQKVDGRSTELRTALSCGASSTDSDYLGPKPSQCHGAGPGPWTTATPGVTRSPPGPAERSATPGGPAPSAAPSAAASSPPVPAGPGEDGSLLDDLGRLIGDLLGG